MITYRPNIVTSIIGAAIVVLTTSSASALPPLRFDNAQAAYSGTVVASVMDQGTIGVLTAVGAGHFVSPSDAILGGTHFLVRELMSKQSSSLIVNAGGRGQTDNDKWKRKQFDKKDADPPRDLSEPSTAWLFGAGLALVILVVLLRKRQTR